MLVVGGATDFVIGAAFDIQGARMKDDDDTHHA